MTISLYAPRFDPMTKDILRSAKESAGLNTRIRLLTDLEKAKKSPNLLTLGRFKELPHSISLPSPAQLKTKGSSLSTLVWSLRRVGSTDAAMPRMTVSSGTLSKITPRTSKETVSFVISRTRTQVVSYLASLLSERTSNSSPRLSLDIETHGDINVLHPVERPLVSIGLYDGDRAVIIPRSLLGPDTYEGRDWAWPGLLKLLAKFDLELHNALFDLPTLTSRLAEEGVDPESYGLKVGFDTMLTHYVIRPAAEQGLKPVAKTVLGVDDWEQLHTFPKSSAQLFETREEWWKYAYPVMEQLVDRQVFEWFARATKMPLVDEVAAELNLSRELALLGVHQWFMEEQSERDFPAIKLDMAKLGAMPEFAVYLYNAYDVLHTWEMRNFLEPLRDRVEGATEASEHLHDFANRIMWDQLEGFPVDTQRATELCAMLEKEIQEHKTQLAEWAHTWVDPSQFPRGQFNPNSPLQIKKLYASVGHTLEKTDVKTLAKLVRRGDKFAAKLLQYRSVAKEHSTYAKKIRDDYNDRAHGEPRLYPWYNLTTTLTGRLSSSGVLNIQNQPKQEEFPVERQLRSLYIPTTLADYELVQVDYSQAELRVMAAVSCDDWLTGIFADSSVDIFTQMTRQIFPHIKDGEKIKLWRRPLKAVVYGLAFGRQAPAIAVELGIPVEEAQRIMDAFLTRADELDMWRKWVMREAVSGGDLITRFGRHFQHEVITNANRANVQRSALSFIPQSTASDLTLKAFNALHDWIRSHKKAWFFRAVVHDALTYDVPVHEVPEAREVISHFMIESARSVIPEVTFAVDAQNARTWAET